MLSNRLTQIRVLIAGGCRRTWVWIRGRLLYAVVWPLCRRLVQWIQSRLPEQDSSLAVATEEGTWKQAAMADFGRWLADLPDDVSPEKAAGMDNCDLYTLLTEFTALRQEIRLQNREQFNAVRALEHAAATIEQARPELAELARHFKHLEADLRAGAEKNALLPLLDLRDNLVRGLAAAQQVTRLRFWHRPAKAMASVVEGYEIALRRFDRGLAQTGIEVVDPEGKPFDPAYMRAIAQSSLAGVAPGNVIRVQSSGFVRGREVIRPAEVVVSAALTDADPPP